MDALIDGSGVGGAGGIVGQNVKSELIRAHRWANEWLIVVTDGEEEQSGLCSPRVHLSVRRRRGRGVPAHAERRSPLKK